MKNAWVPANIKKLKNTSRK